MKRITCKAMSDAEFISSFFCSYQPKTYTRTKERERRKEKERKMKKEREREREIESC